jgi:hypothetical protein
MENKKELKIKKLKDKKKHRIFLINIIKNILYSDQITELNFNKDIEGVILSYFPEPDWKRKKRLHHQLIDFGTTPVLPELRRRKIKSERLKRQRIKAQQYDTYRGFR